MHFTLSLGALVATSSLLVSALPADYSAEVIDRNVNLRLIKTSEADEGTWVTEEEKVEKYITKDINFIDITDISDTEVLTALASPDGQALSAAAAIAYPKNLSHIPEANSFIAKTTTDGPKSWLKSLTDFHTRYYRSTTGTASSSWIFDLATTLTAKSPGSSVSRFTHSFNQPSIIVKIPGTTTNLVIVGAHQDSVGSTSTGRSPGADDDGSGVVTILEGLRVIADATATGWKPKNTLEFHFYAGEEGGLLGSAGIYAKYKADAKNVLGFLNQDMTGYSPGGIAVVYTDYTNADLSAYLRLIVQQYTGKAAGTSRCGYGCSDHASATSNGFPSAFVHEEPFSSSNPKIHSASDTYESIQWDAVTRHIKLTVGFLIEASYL